MTFCARSTKTKRGCSNFTKEKKPNTKVRSERGTTELSKSVNVFVMATSKANAMLRIG
jgi:hypothetical protein